MTGINKPPSELLKIVKSIGTDLEQALEDSNEMRMLEILNKINDINFRPLVDTEGSFL